VGSCAFSCSVIDAFVHTYTLRIANDDTFHVIYLAVGRAIAVSHQTDSLDDQPTWWVKIIGCRLRFMMGRQRLTPKSRAAKALLAAASGWFVGAQDQHHVPELAESVDREPAPPVPSSSFQSLSSYVVHIDCS
jgi:hypothetical protein